MENNNLKASIDTMVDEVAKEPNSTQQTKATTPSAITSSPNAKPNVSNSDASQPNSRPNNNGKFYKEFNVLDEYYSRLGMGNDERKKQIANLYKSGTMDKVQRLGNANAEPYNLDDFDSYLEDYYKQGVLKNNNDLGLNQTEKQINNRVQQIIAHDKKTGYFDLYKPWGNAKDFDPNKEEVDEYSDVKTRAIDDAVYNTKVNGGTIATNLRNMYKRLYYNKMYEYQRKFNHSDAYMDRIGEKQFKERFEHHLGDVDTFVDKAMFYLDKTNKKHEIQRQTKNYLKNRDTYYTDNSPIGVLTKQIKELINEYQTKGNLSESEKAANNAYGYVLSLLEGITPKK